MKKILIFLLIPFLCNANPNNVIHKDLSLPISQKAVDLIIYYEVGGRSYYESKLSKPTVPAWQTTASGVTVGMGTDLGHMTKDDITKAFTGVVSAKELELLKSVSGYKGKSAYYNALPKVKHNIILTWDQSMIVFTRYTLPKFTKQTADAFQLTKNRLPPHSNGALTSLVFNRGPSMANTESRKEMRWIRHNISIKREDKVPSDIKAMKRLWSYTKLKGLHLRRDAEASLFQDGLDAKK